jgi:hypothetical protein
MMNPSDSKPENDNKPEEVSNPSPFGKMLSDIGNYISQQNTITIILVVLLIFSLLGTNFLLGFMNILQTLFGAIGSLVQSIVGVIQVFIVSLYTLILRVFNIARNALGNLLNRSADIASDTVKSGVDVAEVTVNAVGDLLINNDFSLPKSPPSSSIPSSPLAAFPSVSFDSLLNNPLTNYFGSKSAPAPSTSSSPIQQPISASKTSWCLVGEDQGQRGCIEIQYGDKCLSGQIYPSQQDCLRIRPTDNIPDNAPPNMNGTMMVNNNIAPPQLPPPQLPPSQVSVQSASMLPQQQMALQPPPNPLVITADGPPIIQGPPNYFYQRASR